MEVIDPSQAAPPGGSGRAVTIGVFDGVHLGHLRLLERLTASAKGQGWQTAVVTFDPHPATVVHPQPPVKLLGGLDQRLELLAAAGIDVTMVIPFDLARSQESAEDFVEEVLVGALRTRAVVVGPDFRFGHQRRGDVALLEHMGESLDFQVLTVDALAARGAPVSSTRIRQAVAAGDMGSAAEMLGRPYQMRGLVERGDGRGATIGFPTANVVVAPDVAVPAEGIYAGWLAVGEGWRRAAAVSLGRRPTFYGDEAELALEAYVIDFDGDLYGQTARVDLVEMIRSQERFDDVDALVAQIERDVEATRALLEQVTGPGRL
ncbi:MAG: bifunctional riboflavin kinase/FAD synthetase [Acidimicrobiales bacterium]